MHNLWLCLCKKLNNNRITFSANNENYCDIYATDTYQEAIMLESLLCGF